MLGKFLSKTLLLLCFISALVFAAPPSFSEYDAGTLYKGASHSLAKIDTAGERWDELRNNAAKKSSKLCRSLHSFYR